MARTGCCAIFSTSKHSGQGGEVLRDPGEFRPLGCAAEQLIVERYSTEAVLPRMLHFYEHAATLRP